MDQVTMHNHYLLAITEAVTRAGGQNSQLLSQAGISPRLLTEQVQRVPLDDFVSYCRLAWGALGDELFGLSGQPCHPGTFAFLAEQCLSCSTLRQALDKAEQFYQLFTQLRVQRTEENGTVRLEVIRLQPELDPDKLLVDFLLTTWHRFLSWLAGAQVVLTQVEFDFSPPPHLHEYKYTLPASHRFDGQCNALYFSEEYLNKPINRESVELKAFLTDFPFSVLIPPEIDDSFAAKVRCWVKRYADFPVTLPDFDQVACGLNLTSSTLRRKLKAEGTSYQQIKDLLRRDLAIDHMQASALSISEIAHRVGFTEPGAFIRAFKNWTGVTPGCYRSACC